VGLGTWRDGFQGKGLALECASSLLNAGDLLASGEFPATTFISGQRPLEELVPALEAMGRQEGIKYAIIPNH
jgi:hypothetical protein